MAVGAGLQQKRSLTRQFQLLMCNQSSYEQKRLFPLPAFDSHLNLKFCTFSPSFVLSSHESVVHFHQSLSAQAKNHRLHAGQLVTVTELELATGIECFKKHSNGCLPQGNNPFQGFGLGSKDNSFSSLKDLMR